MIAGKQEEAMTGTMKAIDLYAGIGGWSLGLRLAGIDVVHSYEWWQPAIDTHNGNHSTKLEKTNIRTLNLEELPTGIDLVVGSPPCTQFSYSNRGGSGDLADGLVDLERFFEIVAYVKPKYWAMENVPRVARLLEIAFGDPDHEFFKFRHLKPNIGVFDMSQFGCPQARRRCIATNLPLSDIKSFAPKSQELSLGDVVNALAQPTRVTDPIWGVQLPNHLVTEQEKEEFLSEEELRLNRDAKAFHPVYNNMAFPDRMETPARTVTATCTRVSRESIVIRDHTEHEHYRRLTIRERATLQGFPITYQFFGKSFAEKAKMIGNAIPPTFSYVIGCLATGVTAEDFVPHEKLGKRLSLPDHLPVKTPADTAGKTYPLKRRFRAAIPGLRFKSGMRFEFSNDVSRAQTEWGTRFYTGNSKDIRSHTLDKRTLALIVEYANTPDLLDSLEDRGKELSALIASFSGDDLQSVWTRRKSGNSPYIIVDHLGELGDFVFSELETSLASDLTQETVLRILGCASANGKLLNEAKLRRYSHRVLSGLVVCSWFNELSWNTNTAVAA